MDSKFKIGDCVTIVSVDTPSTVGYLGCHHILKMKEFDKTRNEWKYGTEPYNGTGYTWWYEHELMRSDDAVNKSLLPKHW